MILSHKPLIQIVPNFLDTRICNYFLNHDWKWQKSLGFDHDSQAARDTAHRVSSTVFIYDQFNIDFVNYTKSKVSHNFNIPSRHIEALQMARYSAGGFYKHHHDYFFSGKEAENNRIKTVIIYLNDNFTGGCTRFTKLGIDVRPVAGSALFFQYDYDSDTNVLTEHSAEPIIEGEKNIVTAWIRGSVWR